MQIARSIIINAPLEKVWNILAHDFDKVDAWSTGVSSSGVAKIETTNTNAPIAGRVCMTAFGKCYELFEMYDEENHTFTYKAQFDKTPPGIKSGRNTWSLEAISATQTRFTMRGQSEFNLFPGLFMRLPMRFFVPRVLKQNLEEAKHFIETGKPHPRKLKAMQKASQPISTPKAV